MLEFSPDYFKEETIWDFTVPEEMKRAWAAQLKTLDAVMNLCKKHDIKIFGFYGTVLGAVRHKGFIPWDDDIDMGMLRDDYMRFLSVADELGGDYLVKSIQTRDAFSQFHAVVSNSREPKLTYNKDRMEKFYNCPYIVGIDIYPLDKVPPKEDDYTFQKLIYYIGYSLVHDFKKDPRPEDYEKKLALFISKTGVELNISDEDFLIKTMRITDAIASMYKGEDYEKVVYYPSTAYSKNPTLFDKNYFYDLIPWDFENLSMLIPRDYDQFLKSIYGKEYMTPLMYGSDHEYPFYASQKEYFKFLGVTVHG